VAEIRALLLIVVMCLLRAPALFAQTTVDADSDPTRSILFSVRPEFYKADNGAWRQLVVARYDRAVVRKRRWFSGKRGMLLRGELPLAAAGASNLPAQAGLGDAYGQVLIVPRLTRRFAYVVGSGLSMPTATDPLLGSGKWIAAPAAAPIWFLGRRGMVYVKLQNFTSFAGDARRPDVNFLLITPTVISSIGRGYWLMADTETRTDWRLDGRTGVKSGLQVGHVLTRRVGVWVKPEIWWGPNRAGQWNLKTGIVWYQ